MRHASTSFCGLRAALGVDGVRCAVELDHVVGARGRGRGLRFEVSGSVSAMVGQKGDWWTARFEAGIVGGEERVLVDVVWDRVGHIGG